MTDSLSRLLLMLIAIGASLMLLGGALLPSDAEAEPNAFGLLVQTVERIFELL
ncbi:MAG: hypothetical protein AB7O45_04910 [Alphaproteobacteria bacterium]